MLSKLLRPHDVSQFRWTLPRQLDGRNPDPERELKWAKAFLKVRRAEPFSDELMRVLINVPKPTETE